MEHYISFENVVKRYQMGEVEITAVNGVDFSIEKGEFAVIVGPSGAGKTTVLHVLEELGAAVIDCDALYHKLLREDAALLGRIRDRFGPAVFDTEGNLDRKALGNVVFHDQEALSELNALTHAAVLAALDKLLAQAEGSGRKAAAVAASVYNRYRETTGDLTKTIIASTASPFKFTRNVMKAIDARYDGLEDFELADELSKIGNVKVPQAIEEIRHAPVLHDNLCAVEDMPVAVTEFLAIE